MLSTASRSAYICFQCRSRLSQSILQKARPLIRTPALKNPVSLWQSRPFFASPPRVRNDRFPAEENEEEFIDEMVNEVVNKTFGEWTKLGLRPIVSDTLLRAYPNARRPTSVQKKMIQALTYGYSVAVHGLPGTGKSFAIAAWLLGLDRAVRSVTGPNKKKKIVPTTSALVLVPNVDLAIQYYDTIMNMLSNSGSELLRTSPDAFVQLLYRKSNEGELAQLIKLQQFPHPHIIIAPPTIILDILADKDETVRNLIDISNLKSIVLEEIDAAITKLTFFSKMKKTKYPGSSWENKQVPLQILLDYIIKRRLIDARRAKQEVEQPQLIFPSATLSTAQIKRFVVLWHPEWIHAPELQSAAPLFSTQQPGTEWKRHARSNSLIAIEDPPLSRDYIVSSVPDNLHHHVVAYNIRTGTLRDAPLPEINTRNIETLTARIAELEAPHNDQHRFQLWREEAEPSKFVGYPEEIALDALQQLLKHDNYPRNVIAVIGSEGSMPNFREKAAALGITCKPLYARKWNDEVGPGMLPLGRTDMLLDPDKLEELNNMDSGDKSKTTVWLSNFFFCRGLDTPGVRHLYILHRMDRVREYITYCGRVAKWPFATLADEVKDPRSKGRDRRGVGKVVSVLLESPPGQKGPRYDDDIPMETVVLRTDGSSLEQLAWAEEAVKLAKIGCTVEPYFTDRATEVVKVEKVKVEKVKASKGKEASKEKEAKVSKGVKKVKGDAKDETPAFLMEALGLLDTKPDDEVKPLEEGTGNEKITR